MLVDLSLGVLRETESGGDENFLSSREFHLGSSERFETVLDVSFGGSDGEEDLSDFDSACLSVRLTEGSSHTCLESIGSCAGKHLVDSDDVPRVDSDSHVEVILTARLGHVLVAGNTGCFQSLGSELFSLVGHQMHAQRELVPDGSLVSDIVNSDLRIWHTSVVSGFRPGLAAAVSVTSGWSSAHLFVKIYYSK